MSGTVQLLAYCGQAQNLDTVVPVCLQGCQPVRKRPLSEHCRRMGAGLVVRRPHHPQVHVLVLPTANPGWLLPAYAMLSSVI